VTNDERPKREHHRSHFTRRLEAFSDIVFGLCLAQTAVQLGLPNRAEDLISPHAVLRYVIFFVTFALVAFYWFAHYRMFRLAFEPYPLDVVLNFAFLALTALLPFTMQVNIRFANTPTIGLPFYAGNLLLTSLVMATLLQRGLARRDPTLTADERLGLWKAALRNLAVTGAAAAALIALSVIPPPWTGMAGFAFPLVIVPFMGFVRRRVKTVPARFLPTGVPAA
jgi:uncharacterized membrane protein